MNKIYNEYLKQAKENNLYDYFEQYYYVTDAKIKIFIESFGVLTLYRYLALLDNQSIKQYYKIQYNTSFDNMLSLSNCTTNKEYLYSINDIEYEETFTTLADFVTKLKNMILENYNYSNLSKIQLRNIFVFGDNIYFKHKVKLLENNKFVKKVSYEKKMFYDFLQFYMDDNIIELIEKEYNSYIDNIDTYNINSFLNINLITYLHTEYKKAYTIISKTFTSNEINNILNDFEYNTRQLNYFYLHAIIMHVLTNIDIKEKDRIKYKKILVILITNAFDKLYVLENLIYNYFNL